MKVTKHFLITALGTPCHHLPALPELCLAPSPRCTFRVNPCGYFWVCRYEWEMGSPAGKWSCTARRYPDISFPTEQLHSPAAQAAPADAKENPGLLQVLLNIDIQFTEDGWTQLGDGGERRIACWLLYQAGTRAQAARGGSGREEHLWTEWPSVWKAIFPGCTWILTQPNSEMQRRAWSLQE